MSLFPRFRLGPALAALAAGLLLAMPAALLGQAGVGTSQSGGTIPNIDTGFVSPGDRPTAADSLPAFRSDSLDDRNIREAESAPSPFAQSPARDSADSVAALLRGRRPAVSLYAGIDFIDLDATDALVDALDARIDRDSLVVLQPYESVHLAFPFGIQAVLPAGAYFDLVAKTHSYWYKQTAVLGRANVTDANDDKDEEFFAVQAHLGGAGLRYHIPPALLTVTGNLGLYVQGVYYWLLGGGELYTNHGSAPAEFDPAGSAWEIQLGLNRPVSRFWGITGNIGYMAQNYASDKPWSAILVDRAPAGTVDWELAAITANFNLWYYFGVPKPAKAPPRSASPALTAPTAPTPAK